MTRRAPGRALPPAPIFYRGDLHLEENAYIITIAPVGRGRQPAVRQRGRRR